MPAAAEAAGLEAPREREEDRKGIKSVGKNCEETKANEKRAKAGRRGVMNKTTALTRPLETIKCMTTG
jgi:hypothetical protein